MVVVLAVVVLVAVLYEVLVLALVVSVLHRNRDKPTCFIVKFPYRGGRKGGGRRRCKELYIKTVWFVCVSTSSRRTRNACLTVLVFELFLAQ